MLRTSLFAAALGLAALSPALAQDSAAQCDDAGMKALQSSIDMTTDQAMKTMAADHMKMAQDAMKAGNTDQCAVHMGEARKALGAKS